MDHLPPGCVRHCAKQFASLIPKTTLQTRHFYSYFPDKQIVCQRSSHTPVSGRPEAGMQRTVSKALLYYYGRKSDERHAKRIKRTGAATSVHEKRGRRESKLRRSGTGLSTRRRRREAVPEVGRGFRTSRRKWLVSAADRSRWRSFRVELLVVHEVL